MKPTAHEYYGELSRDYATTIRQLVPRYDELVETSVAMLAVEPLDRVLEIGAGVGLVAEAVLARLPGARVTALDAADTMVAAARSRLARFGERAEVVCADAAAFTPADRYGAVFSTLALHNVPYEDKSGLLSRVAGWLAPGGTFVWGDMIRYDDPAVQEYYVRYRVSYARDAGCSPGLIRRSFAKEAEEDHPLTVEETYQLLVAVGFRSISNVWTHDTFTLFRARAPGE